MALILNVFASLAPRFTKCIPCGLYTSVFLRHNMLSRVSACSFSLTPKPHYARRSLYKQEELVSRAYLLASVFMTTEKEMQNFLSCNRKLVMMGKEKFNQLTHLLAEHGITKAQIMTYPDVYRRKYETVANRIKQLEEGGVKPVTLNMINTTCKIYEAKLRRLVVDTAALEQYKNIVEFLMVTFEFSRTEAELLCIESQWLARSKLSTLKEKFELLCAYGVPVKAVKDRIWILTFPAKTIKTRLHALKKSGICYEDCPKSFLNMVRSTDENFEKFCKDCLLDKAVLLQYSVGNKEQYLCHRLCCSHSDLTNMERKYPALMSVGLPKLECILDILLKDCNLSNADILEYPRVLCQSSVTLWKKIEKLRMHGLPVSCRVLTLTSAHFELYMSKV